MIDWDALLADGPPAAPAMADEEPQAEAGFVPVVALECDAFTTDGPSNALDLPGIEAGERCGDDRRYCIECGSLAESGRCLAAMRRQIVASRNYEPVRDILRRCQGFNPLPSDPDQRHARDRWTGL